MNFNGVVTAGANDGFGNAKAVDTLVNDADSFSKLVGFLEILFAFKSRVIDFECKSDTALEIETEFYFALGGLEKVTEENFVAFIKVFDVGKVDFWEKDRVVDLFFFADFGEGDEERGGLVILNAGFGFMEYIVEFEWLSSGFGFYIFRERNVIHWEDIDDSPRENDDGDDEFAKCIAGHRMKDR